MSAKEKNPTKISRRVASDRYNHKPDSWYNRCVFGTVFKKNISNFKGPLSTAPPYSACRMTLLHSQSLNMGSVINTMGMDFYQN